MSRIASRLKPTNRHLAIVPHFKDNKNDTGVLLPEDYSPEQNKYVEATVVDVADDCSKQFEQLRYGTLTEKKIVVDASMIEEVKIADKKTFIVLENYVVGIYRRPDES